MKWASNARRPAGWRAGGWRRRRRQVGRAPAPRQLAASNYEIAPAESMGSPARRRSRRAANWRASKLREQRAALPGRYSAASAAITLCGMQSGGKGPPACVSCCLLRTARRAWGHCCAIRPENAVLLMPLTAHARLTAGLLRGDQPPPPACRSRRHKPHTPSSLRRCPSHTDLLHADGHCAVSVPWL